jgi:phage tail-like protein
MGAETFPHDQSFPAFRFVVEIGNQAAGAFTECDLPSIEWDVEEVKEGGLNTHIHQLPGRRKAGKVSLKNGVAKSTLVTWYLNAMEETIERKPVTIKLKDSLGNTVLAWHMLGAYPVRWAGPQLRSDSNAIAIQTLDLACGQITVDNG